MVRTGIRAAAGRRPETSILSGQARAVPECLTIATRPLAARDFLIRAEQRVTLLTVTGIREEGFIGARFFAQIKAAIVFFFSITEVSTRK
jgi:hypothetical protein